MFLYTGLMTRAPFKPNPKLDVVLERTIDIPPAAVWAAWTTPKHLKEWFCPLPWKTIDCEMDLRPGGLFRTVMQSPEGQSFPNEGCFLEVVPNERLVWTDALAADFRPSGRAYLAEQMGHFTAMILLEPHGQGGTRYTAVGIHSKESDRAKHEAMGFEVGWGTALKQLVEYMKKQL